MISFGAMANRAELGQLKWKVSHMPKGRLWPTHKCNPLANTVRGSRATFFNEIWASRRLQGKSSRGATQTGAPFCLPRLVPQVD